jgi:hypothetical protein
MAAVLSVFAVVLASMLINRLATIVLSLTGMSREEARFQARAAMSGVALTTNSAEDIAGHPIRRRVVLWLMIVGSAGIVTAIASLVLSFNAGSTRQRLSRASVLIVGIRRPKDGYLGAPGPDTVIRALDTLIVYGREQRIAKLDQRAGGAQGEAMHTRACAQRATRRAPPMTAERLCTAVCPLAAG